MHSNASLSLYVAGASAYPRVIDFEKFAAIAKEVGAYLDGRYGAYCRSCCRRTFTRSPVPFADVVTTTTHKTLRGPRGGLILNK